MGASSQRLPAAYMWKTYLENSIESRTCGRCEVHLQVASVKPDSGNVRDVALTIIPARSFSAFFIGGIPKTMAFNTKMI